MGWAIPPLLFLIMNPWQQKQDPGKKCREARQEMERFCRRPDLPFVSKLSHEDACEHFRKTVDRVCVDPNNPAMGRSSSGGRGVLGGNARAANDKRIESRGGRGLRDSDPRTPDRGFQDILENNRRVQERQRAEAIRKARQTHRGNCLLGSDTDSLGRRCGGRAKENKGGFFDPKSPNFGIVSSIQRQP